MRRQILMDRVVGKIISSVNNSLVSFLLHHEL